MSKSDARLLACVLSAGLCLVAMASASAAPPGESSQVDADAQPPRTVSAPNAVEYFIDLKDGARIPPDIHLRLGLANMGVAPAGASFPMTGHHHILIDAPLPPFDQPIPADDNHIHLGAGQTEITLTLAPGPHTLQLLLGDHDHVTHNPPIYSALIHVIVARPRTPSPPDAAVYFVSPHDGDIIPSTSTVRFGLHGMGVAPSSVSRANAGHHHLVVDADTPDAEQELPADGKHLPFGGGQTETDVTLPPGKHALQLVFGDRNDLSFDPPVVSKRITVTVRDQAKAGP